MASFFAILYFISSLFLLQAYYSEAFVVSISKLSSQTLSVRAKKSDCSLRFSASSADTRRGSLHLKASNILHRTKLRGGSLEKPSSPRRFPSCSPLSACQSSTTPAVSRGIKVVIAGAPAAGKGTQCEKIVSQFGLVHLSTGDILRAAVKAKTPLGEEAKKFMDGGQLVPDDLIIGLVLDRLNQADCQEKGWLLDGFPRTASQAKALTAAGHVPDCFLLLDVPESVLLERVTGRRTDPTTGVIYHLKFNPPPAEVMSRLVQRSDDTAEKIVLRYKEFKSHIDNVIHSYQEVLVTVDGSRAAADITKEVTEKLQAVQQSKVDGACCGEQEVGGDHHHSKECCKSVNSGDATSASM